MKSSAFSWLIHGDHSSCTRFFSCRLQLKGTNWTSFWQKCTFIRAESRNFCLSLHSYHVYPYVPFFTCSYSKSLRLTVYHDIRATSKTPNAPSAQGLGRISKGHRVWRLILIAMDLVLAHPTGNHSLHFHTIDYWRDINDHECIIYAQYCFYKQSQHFRLWTALKLSIQCFLMLCCGKGVGSSCKGPPGLALSRGYVQFNALGEVFYPGEKARYSYWW